MSTKEEYEVDLTKPPIPPPCRSIKCGLGGDFETEASKQRTARWSNYIKKRRKALEESRKDDRIHQ